MCGSINRARNKKLSVNSASMAGGSVRASAGPPSQRSTQGGPRPVAPGPSGSTCAAHNHTRARAHARARPRCTLQHTIPLHCTFTTHAHFCTCTMTYPPRRGAGGRSGRRRARQGGAAPTERHRGPPQGLQPLQHEATRRFGTSNQLVDKSALCELAKEASRIFFAVS